MRKEDRLKKIGEKVFTIISYEKGILKTTGEGIYKGEEIPPSGLVKMKGIDVNQMKFESPKIEFPDGTIVYGTMIHYNFVDATIRVSTGINKDREVNLWQYMKSSAKEIIEIKPADFLEGYKKEHS